MYGRGSWNVFVDLPHELQARLCTSRCTSRPASSHRHIDSVKLTVYWLILCQEVSVNPETLYKDLQISPYYQSK